MSAVPAREDLAYFAERVPTPVDLGSLVETGS
jgi:hypothetical protein